MGHICNFGRKTHEYGVIFPAICEYVNQGKIVDKRYFYLVIQNLDKLQQENKLIKLFLKQKVTFKIEYIFRF